MVPPFSRRISPIKGKSLIPQYHRDVKGVTIEISKNRGRTARFGAYCQRKTAGGPVYRATPAARRKFAISGQEHHWATAGVPLSLSAGTQRTTWRADSG